MTDYRITPEFAAHLAVEARERAANHPISVSQARVLVLGLIEPAELRHRVTETYEFTGKTLIKSVLIDYRVPHIKNTDNPVGTISGWGAGTRDGNNPLLLPIRQVSTLAEAHEALLDRDGVLVHTLDRESTVSTFALILRILTTIAYGAQNRPDLLAAEHLALTLMATRQFGHHVDAVERERLLEMLGAEGAQSSAENKVLLQFLRIVTTYLIVVAPLPIGEGGSYTLIFERSVVPRYARQSRIRRLLFFIRTLLAAHPPSLQVPLDVAQSASIYDVWIKVPRGLYLRNQVVSELASQGPIHVSTTVAGQPHAHIQISNAREANINTSEPTAEFKFAEIPPTANVTATGAALVCLLLAWIVGLVMSRGDSVGTDAPALLLAVPAAVAGWLSFPKPSREVFSGSLSSKLSLLITFVLSLVASALFMAQQARWYALPDSGAMFMGVSWPAWAVIVLLAMLNTVYAGILAVRDTIVYVRAVTGSPSVGQI